MLQQIETWIRPRPNEGDAHAPQALPDEYPNIFWLSGLAGTGKTTIAYTIAKWCAERAILGATFFCSRSDIDCSDASKIIGTIAYQLARFHSPYEHLLSGVLHSDRFVVNAALPTQLAKLIVEPLHELSVTSPIPECVVLIDAADECSKKTATSSLLSSLLFHANSLRPVRFLITSRPEKHITVPFNRLKFQDASGRLVLHLVELAQVTQDIELYLWTLLSGDVAEQFAVPVNWPDHKDIQALARLAKGLFIFAATLVRFISDAKYSNPCGQLRRVLSSPPSSYAFLDQLYLQVLASAVADASDELVNTMRLLVGSIVLAKEPLSPRTLAALLGIDVLDVVNALAGLHAVLIIPGPNELDKFIRLIHPTFAEFLTNPGRCTNAQFLVILTAHHAILLDRCLRIMAHHLKRDICHIGDPTLSKSEIDDLPGRIAQHIPLHLAYACRHWVAHAEQCELSEALLQNLNEFVHRHLLNWVEASSLIGVLRESVVALSSVERNLKVRDARSRVSTSADNVAAYRRAPLSLHGTPHRLLPIDSGGFPHHLHIPSPCLPVCVAICPVRHGARKDTGPGNAVLGARGARDPGAVKPSFESIGGARRSDAHDLRCAVLARRRNVHLSGRRSLGCGVGHSVLCGPSHPGRTRQLCPLRAELSRRRVHCIWISGQDASGLGHGVGNYRQAPRRPCRLGLGGRFYSRRQARRNGLPGSLCKDLEHRDGRLRCYFQEAPH